MTNTALADATLASLVTDHPEWGPVLNKLGLDYCCHGQRSLADASKAAGIEADKVVARLQATDTGEAPDWGSLEPAQLLDHVVITHHAFLREELPFLEPLANKVRDVHGERHPELVEVADIVHEITGALGTHINDEEISLFPAIKDVLFNGPREGGALPADIEANMAEHEVVGEKLERLREITGGFQLPPDACASYTTLYHELDNLEADTHIHVHKENNIVFPAALKAAT